MVDELESYQVLAYRLGLGVFSVEWSPGCMGYANGCLCDICAWRLKYPPEQKSQPWQAKPLTASE